MEGLTKADPILATPTDNRAINLGRIANGHTPNLQMLRRVAPDTSVWRDYLQTTDEQIEAAEEERQDEKKQKERAGRTRFAVQETCDHASGAQTDNTTDPVC